MNINRVNEKEIPYQSLEEFGLTRNMISDLPMDVILQILSGQRSPVLPIEVVGTDGQKVRSKAKFSLVRSDAGKVDVVFHPVFKTMEDSLCVVSKDSSTGKESLGVVDARTLYSLDVFNGLKMGKVMMDYSTTGDGRRIKSFLQLDPETREVLSVPSQVIGRNIQTLVGEFNLTTAETNCLQNGEVLTVSQEDELLSIGIDLNYPTGLRLEKGDERRWKERASREWNSYSVGVFGCWKIEDGELSYIDEEDYTEEVWTEIERQRNFRKINQSSFKM